MFDYVYGLGFFVFTIGTWVWLIGIPAGYLLWHLAVNYVTDKKALIQCKGLLVERIDEEDPGVLLIVMMLCTLVVVTVGFVWPIALPVLTVMLTLRCLRWCYRLKTKVGVINKAAHEHTGKRKNVVPVETPEVTF